MTLWNAREWRTQLAMTPLSTQSFQSIAATTHHKKNIPRKLTQMHEKGARIKLRLMFATGTLISTCKTNRQPRMRLACMTDEVTCSPFIATPTLTHTHSLSHFPFSVFLPKSVLTTQPTFIRPFFLIFCFSFPGTDINSHICPENFRIYAAVQHSTVQQRGLDSASHLRTPHGALIQAHLCY